MHLFKCRTQGMWNGSLIVGVCSARGCLGLSSVVVWGLLLSVVYIGRRAPNVVAGFAVHRTKI